MHDSLWVVSQLVGMLLGATSGLLCMAVWHNRSRKKRP